jgi:hypothetical protein
MSLKDEIATEVLAGRLNSTWTTADLRNNLNLRKLFSLNTLNTAPPNQSISLPGLGLGGGANVNPQSPNFWRIGRRHGTLLFNIEPVTPNASLASSAPEPDDTGLEPIVESDPPVQGAITPGWTVTALTPLAVSILKELVGDIDASRRWADRLADYLWQGKDFQATQLGLESILWRGSVFARLADLRQPWSPEDKAQAVSWAQEVFTWGGTRQRNPVTDVKVHQTLENAVSNCIRHPGAPMNSGYTKLASFATDHREDVPGGIPQVINDSRVATSLTHRLDTILQKKGILPSSVFPELGTVNVGRGGTRPRQLALAWPTAYGSWKGQFAATQVVMAIRDILNADLESYPPEQSSRWTVRMVEAVLFMDGY